jgi:hypothetical protein
MDQTADSGGASRGVFLTIITVLFVLLAISDFTKFFQYANKPEIGGLVILGHKFQGVGNNLVLGWIFGAVLLTYAYGIWNLRAWVLPISIAYAFYVPTNLVLFWSLHQLTPPTVRFIVMYLILSVGGSVGTAIYLAYHRERLH